MKQLPLAARAARVIQVVQAHAAVSESGWRRLHPRRGHQVHPSSLVTPNRMHYTYDQTHRISKMYNIFIKRITFLYWMVFLRIYQIDSLESIFKG